jgi:hypothetical protein
MAAKPRPDGHHSVTPYLVVDGAARVIDFLKQVLNAQEVMRLAAPGVASAMPTAHRRSHGDAGRCTSRAPGDAGDAGDALRICG